MTFALSYIYLACFAAVLVQCATLAASTSDQPAKRPILISMALVACWALVDFLSNLAATPEQMRVLSLIFVFSWSLAPVFALRAALAYAGQRRLLSAWWFWIPLLLPTAVFYFLEWRGRFHLAFVPAAENAGFFQSVASPVQWAVDAYMITAFILAGWLLFAQARRTGRLEFRATWRMFWALLVPGVLVGALFNGSLNPVGLRMPYLGSIIASLLVLVVARWIRKRRLFVPMAVLHQRAQSALNSSEARFQTLLDISPDAVCLTDTAGRILSANMAAARMFGFESPADLGGGGVHFSALVGPVDRERAEAIAEEVLGQGQVVRGEFQLRRLDGSGFLGDAAIGVLPGAAGEPIGLIGIVRDLSERVDAEQQRQTLQRQVLHAQKLESLGLLAGGIAHDFNNLLGGIIGNTSLARLDLPSDSQAAGRLEKIELAAERAAMLAHEMLAYSGRGDFSRSQVDLRKVVEDISGLLRVSIPKRIRLDFDFAAGLPSISADASQIQQVVLNLITNAAESFGDRAGEIALRLRTEQLGPGELADTVSQQDIPAGSYLVLEVQDEGQGMEAGTLAQIFDPFFSTKFTGRGLGLAAVGGIVAAHQAFIQVRSTPGRGTRFCILFPVEAGAPSAEVAAGPDEDMLGRWRGQGIVLVVDDEELMRGVMSDILRLVGFEVIQAADGPAALDAFSGRGEDVVTAVIDMTMPRMLGDEVMARLRARRPDLPVVLVSGYCRAAPACVEADRRAAFLMKPFVPPSLIERLHAVLAAKA